MGGVNSEDIFNFAMQMLCPIADGGVLPGRISSHFGVRHAIFL